MIDRTATPAAGLKQLQGFEGGVDDLALAAENVLAAIGEPASDEAASLNARLIRDYTQRGILSRPERMGKEALYKYQHLVELVAARILLSDGWPLAKVSDYIASAKLDDLIALAEPQSPAKSALKAINAIRERSSRFVGAKPTMGQVSQKAAAALRSIPDRQARLAELRAQLPLYMGRIGEAHKAPLSNSYTSVSLAEDLHLLIGDVRLRALSLEEAEAIGKAATAALIQLRPKGNKP